VLELGAQGFLDLTGGRWDGDFDVIFDVIGGDILEHSIARVRPGGTVVTIATPPPSQPEEGRAVFFVVEPNRTQLVELAQRVRDGRLRPVIGSVRPLAETADAFARHGHGKTIIEVLATDKE
jgi:NADPH:quinone reductase-like Zn-dependent oxidoreductase